MRHKINKICYVGIYPPKAPRDAVYLEELRKRGIEVVEAVDNSAGWGKYRNICREIRRVSADADLIWVGYLSPIVVLVARIACRKKIIYNALASSYEAYVLDRAVCSRYSPKAAMFWLSDFLAFHFASKVLVESEAQKRFLSKIFIVSSKKLEVVYTGVREETFRPDQSVTKNPNFTVLFRGMFLPATGVEYVLEAAKILKDEKIKFLIIGWGQLKNKVVKYIKDNNLDNVELLTVFLEPNDLRRRMLSAHVMLGQFSDNSRMDRTIQHKTSEALALGMPYITRDSESSRELLRDGENCIFVCPANAMALAEKILWLKNNPIVMKSIGEQARKTYENKLAQSILVDKVFNIIDKII